jgi:hypothetical protein
MPDGGAGEHTESYFPEPRTAPEDVPLQSRPSEREVRR